MSCDFYDLLEEEKETSLEEQSDDIYLYSSWLIASSSSSE